MELGSISSPDASELEFGIFFVLIDRIIRDVLHQRFLETFFLHCLSTNRNRLQVQAELGKNRKKNSVTILTDLSCELRDCAHSGSIGRFEGLDRLAPRDTCLGHDQVDVPRLGFQSHRSPPPPHLQLLGFRQRRMVSPALPSQMTYRAACACNWELRSSIFVAPILYKFPKCGL